MEVQPPPVPGAGVVIAGVTPPQISSAPAVVTGSATPAPSVAAPASAGNDGVKGAGIKATNEGSALAPAIAKLFGNGSIPQPLALNVSYRVLKDHEIVTVFTDPRTGQEIAQFPPEVIIGLAEFFDQQQGATLDQSA